jgi:hypothetical protein
VKKAVFNEMPEDVDLKATSRRYVESISKIHEVARGLIAGSVNSARAAIEAARARYAAVYPDNLVGITASAMREEREVSFVPLHLEWDDVRIELQKRNVQLANLAKRYVTGRTMKLRRETPPRPECS